MALCSLMALECAQIRPASFEPSRPEVLQCAGTHKVSIPLSVIFKPPQTAQVLKAIAGRAVTLDLFFLRDGVFTVLEQVGLGLHRPTGNARSWPCL